MFAFVNFIDQHISSPTAIELSEFTSLVENLFSLDLDAVIALEDRNYANSLIETSQVLGFALFVIQIILLMIG